MPEIDGPWRDTALVLQSVMKARGATIIETRHLLRMNKRNFSMLIRGVEIPRQVAQYAHWAAFIDLPLLFEAIGRDLARQVDEGSFATAGAEHPRIRLSVHVDAVLEGEAPYRVDYIVQSDDGMVIRGIWPTRFSSVNTAEKSLAGIRIALANEFHVN